jgi:hypothetical protein
MRHRSPTMTDELPAVPAGIAPLTMDDAALVVNGYAARLEAHRIAVEAVRRRCQRAVFGGRLANDVLDLLGDLR